MSDQVTPGGGTVTLKKRGPITVATPNRGTVTLRWLTLSSLTALERLRKEHGATEEFVLLALHQELLSPAASLEEFRAWSGGDRRALAVGWAQHPDGLHQAIDAARLPGSFVEAFDRHLADLGKEMAKGLASAFGSIQQQRELITNALGSIQQDHERLFGGTAAIARALEGFRGAESAWKDSLLAGRKAMSELIGDPLLEQRRLFLAANESQAAFLKDIASTIAFRDQLASLAPQLGGITDALRRSAAYTAGLSDAIAQSGMTRAVEALNLSRGLESLTIAARGVWADWGKGALLPGRKWLQQAPSVEVFSASRAAAAAIGLPIEDEPAAPLQQLELVAQSLEARLARIAPELVDMLRGAKRAAATGGPDSGRHLAVSLRELLTHVLHRLAPDEELHAWDGRLPEDFDKGKPTRRGRLRYIHRRLAGTAYFHFLTEDVGRTVDLMQLLNSDTHRLEKPLTEHAQQVILRSVEGVLATVLEVARDDF